MTDTVTQIRGLTATTSQELPFAPGLSVRAFLLERADGNILIYNTGAMERDVALITEKGVARHYLSHWHEAMFGAAQPAREAGATVHVAEADAAQVERHRLAVDERFADAHTVGDDLEVIPIPGHTPGATAFLWDTGEHRVLFTGDTIYLGDGGWVAGLLESSDREKFVASLERLRDLEFDVLAPWGASDGGPYVVGVEPGEGRRRIQALVDDLPGSPG